MRVNVCFSWLRKDFVTGEREMSLQNQTSFCVGQRSESNGWMTKASLKKTRYERLCQGIDPI